MSLPKIFNNVPKYGPVAIILTGAGAILSYFSAFQVPGGHRAVIFNRFTGVKNQVYSEGINFILPLIEKRYIVPVRTQSSNLITNTGSRVGIRILFRPNISELPMLFSKIGLDYEAKIIPSIGNEVLKSVVAQFNVSQLITMRQQVSLMVKDQLTEKAREFHFVIEDVAITDLSFSHEYTAAVEAKQIAQQEAQRAAFVVDRAKQERQRKIVQAQGEAQAALLLGEAIKENSGYLELRKIRAAQNIAKIIANGNNRVYLDSDSLMTNFKVL